MSLDIRLMQVLGSIAPGFAGRVRARRDRARREMERTEFMRRIYGAGDHREVFQRIYETNHWNSAESRSGPGSSLDRTARLRPHLEAFLEREKIRTLFDAPCGDFNWMRAVNFPAGMRYMGADIVRELVVANRREHASTGRTFFHMDILADPLPAADAWLCRDCLFHFPNAAVVQVLDRWKCAPIRMFLSTTYPHSGANEEIMFGEYRRINLEAPPFNLPPPAEYLPDFSIDDTDRYIGVWVKPPRD